MQGIINATMPEVVEGGKKELIGLPCWCDKTVFAEK